MTEKTTRAAVAPPPKKHQTFLPESASGQEVKAADNMKGKRLIGMTFNMEEDWHTRFKVTAATRGIKMRELLIQSFAAWEEKERRRD